VERILVVGVTGAGKSTLAQTLSSRLRLPYHEMDALYFNGPSWSTNGKLTEDVSKLTATPRWIIDSLGYPEVRDLLWDRADTVIWLDYPKHVIMPRVLRRSLRRTVTREVLFGGNRETWTDWLHREHPAWWAWTQHGPRHREIEHRLRDPRFAALHTLHFRRPRDTTAWLTTLPPAGPDTRTSPSPTD
jgi:adenylate kinase family enzyme